MNFTINGIESPLKELSIDHDERGSCGSEIEDSDDGSSDEEGEE
jgi:hypothetical protein